MRFTRLALGFILFGARVLAAPVDLVGTSAPGSGPATPLPLVGAWTVQQDGASTAIMVDGSRWREGSVAASLDKSASAAFPHAAKPFADAVKRHAFFPLAVIEAVASLDTGTVTVWFKPLAGREDQAAGIAFALQPSGDYLALRANGLEHNLILFQFSNGRRTALKEVRADAPKTGRWHELKMIMERGVLRGSVDGKQYLEFELTQSTNGRIGLWSKADSVVPFRNLDVQRGARPSRSLA